MSFLTLPAGILEIVVDYLNPGPSISGYDRAYSQTACICKVNDVRAREQPTCPMSVESKRSILALSSVSKSLRMAIFDLVFWKRLTMDWKHDSLLTTRLSLHLTTRAKVQTLILQANSIDRPGIRPPLTDYINLFPRLREIQIVLVYPRMPDQPKRNKGHETVNMGHRKTTSPSATVSDTTTQRHSSLQSISLAIYQETSFRGRTDEGFTRKSLTEFASADHLEKLNMAKLDKYHLELAFSKTRFERSKPTFWNEFMLRMENACQIPAKNVSMCFSFQLNGESERFLAELSRAIARWPEEVEDISFCLQLDEFVLMGGHRMISNLVNPGKDGSLELVHGYLPSKRDLDQFVGTIRKTRPNLRNFDLVIYTFTRYNRPLLEYRHAIAAVAIAIDQVPEPFKLPSSIFKIEYSELEHLHVQYLAQKRAISDAHEAYGSGILLQEGLEAEFEEQMDILVGMNEETAIDQYRFEENFYHDNHDSEDSSS